VDRVHDQVASVVEPVAAGNAGDVFQPAVGLVLAPEHPAADGSGQRIAGGRLDEDAMAVDLAEVQVSLVPAHGGSLRFRNDPADLSSVHDSVDHSFVQIQTNKPSMKTAISGSRFKARLFCNDQPVSLRGGRAANDGSSARVLLVYSRQVAPNRRSSLRSSYSIAGG